LALDQKTGQEKWQVQLNDFANCHGCNFTSPPVVAGDVLTYGSTAGELAGSVPGSAADPILTVPSKQANPKPVV